MKRTATIIRAIALGLLASATTNAADSNTGNQSYIGGLVGLSAVPTDIKSATATTGPSVGSGVGYGLNGGYFFVPSVGLGAYIRGGNQDHGITSFFVGAEGLYRFADSLPGLQLGAAIGSGKFSGGGFAGYNNFTFGFKAAYDYPISSQYPLSLGIDLGLTWMSATNSLVGDSITYTIWNPAATLKLWF